MRAELVACASNRSPENSPRIALPLVAVSSARSAVIAPSRRDEEEAVASSDPVRMAPRKAAPLDSIRRVSGADTGPSKRDEEVATMSSVPSLLTGALKREPLDSVI